jgi:hypothetical protein
MGIFTADVGDRLQLFQLVNNQFLVADWESANWEIFSQRVQLVTHDIAEYYSHKVPIFFGLFALHSWILWIYYSFFYI